MKKKTKFVIFFVVLILIIWLFSIPYFLLFFYGSFIPLFDPNTYPRVSFDQELNIIGNASLSGNTDLCYKLPQERKEPLTYRTPRADCFKSVAISTKNVSLCFSKEVIGFGGFGQNGNHDCYNDVAVETRNLSLCMEIINKFSDIEKDRLSNCISSIASLTNNETICDLYGKSSDDHLLCRMYFENSSSSLCLNATTDWFKERCNQYFGIEN